MPRSFRATLVVDTVGLNLTRLTSSESESIVT